MKSDVYDKVSERTMKLIDEIKRHLDDNNKGEIVRDGFKISIVVR